MGAGLPSDVRGGICRRTVDEAQRRISAACRCNLTSQFFANLYLNELDQSPHRLRVRGYVRYMDDLVLFTMTRPSAELRRHSRICEGTPAPVSILRRPLAARQGVFWVPALRTHRRLKRAASGFERRSGRNSCHPRNAGWCCGAGGACGHVPVGSEPQCACRPREHLEAALPVV